MNNKNLINFGLAVGQKSRKCLVNYLAFIRNIRMKFYIMTFIVVFSVCIISYILNVVKSNNLEKQLISYYSSNYSQKANLMTSKEIKKDILSKFSGILLAKVSSDIAFELYNNNKIQDAIKVLEYTVSSLPNSYYKDVLSLSLNSISTNNAVKIKSNIKYLLQENLADKMLSEGKKEEYKEVILKLSKDNHITSPYLKDRLEEILYTLYE